MAAKTQPQSVVDPKSIDLPPEGGGSVVVHENAGIAHMVTPQSEGMAMISMLERLCRDPAIPIDRIERMTALLKEQRDDQRRIAFGVAMAACQADLEPIRRNSNAPNWKYAKLEDVDRLIRPIYNRHGFSVTFTSSEMRDPAIVPMIAIVAHNEGYQRTYRFDVPTETKGPKGNDVMTITHAAGSANTFGRRNLLGMIFNLTFTDDDDGAAAGGMGVEQPLLPKQVDAIRALLKETETDEAAFLVWIAAAIKKPKIDKIDDLPQSCAEKALVSLRRKRDGMKGGRKANAE